MLRRCSVSKGVDRLDPELPAALGGGNDVPQGARQRKPAGHRSGPLRGIEAPKLYRLSGSVLNRFTAFSVVRAVSAAVEASPDLGAVPNDPAAAVLAYRRHGVDGAFEAVEDMSGSSSQHFEAHVVVVAADFTGSQRSCPLPR